MDTTEQIKQLERKVEQLTRVVLSLSNASQVDPMIIKALMESGVKSYDDAVADYDQLVSESGSGSYTVAKVYDGLFMINGKVVGYYNPV